MEGIINGERMDQSPADALRRLCRIVLVVILAIVIAANWLADHQNKTFDVTANKQYTLSDETKKVTGNLKKNVTVYYFDKSDSYDRARDMLDRYKNLSLAYRRRVCRSRQEAGCGPRRGHAQLRRHHRRQRRRRRKRRKALTEEELTGALVRVSKSGARKACFVNGSGEQTLDDTGREGYSAFKDALEKNNYKTQTISLIQKPEVPKDCNVVIVAGPKRDYLPPAIDAIKAYVQEADG